MAILIDYIEDVLVMRQKNPCATLQEIGDRFGVTRERIRQILTENNLPTRHFVQNQYICLNCRQPFKRPHKGHLFCSLKCRHDYAYIKIACTWCGKLNEYHAKTMLWKIQNNPLARGKASFCDKHCQGKWLAANYGFGVFSKHGRRG